MVKDRLLDEVADRLRTDAGLTDVFVEHHVGCVVVPCGRYELWFGTANETWGADVNLNGEPWADVCGLVTEVPSDCDDASEIARAITVAAMRFDRGTKVLVVDGEGQAHGPDCKCLICPNCGATEMVDCRLPVNDWRFQIRAFRVDDASHCLKCDRWFTL